MSTWRGTTRIVLAVALFALVSALAVTVEVATFAVARTEAQRAADAGALAGAAFLIFQPDDEFGARAEAQTFARLNTVRGRTPEVRPEDVVVNLDLGLVSVRVHATVHGLPTLLSWILGVDAVSVSAEAAAEARAPREGRPPKILKLVEASATRREAETQCPALRPHFQASAQDLVDNAVKHGIGGSLQNSDPSSLRPLTESGDCKKLEKLIDPNYAITGNQPEFLVNYFQVDCTFPGPVVVTLSIAVLNRNPKVSTIDGPTVFLVYFPSTEGGELIGTYLST
jgi:hypothetical protein